MKGWNWPFTKCRSCLTRMVLTPVFCCCFNLCWDHEWRTGIFLKHWFAKALMLARAAWPRFKRLKCICCTKTSTTTPSLATFVEVAKWPKTSLACKVGVGQERSFCGNWCCPVHCKWRAREESCTLHCWNAWIKTMTKEKKGKTLVWKCFNVWNKWWWTCIRGKWRWKRQRKQRRKRRPKLRCTTIAAMLWACWEMWSMSKTWKRLFYLMEFEVLVVPWVFAFVFLKCTKILKSFLKWICMIECPYNNCINCVFPNARNRAIMALALWPIATRRTRNQTNPLCFFMGSMMETPLVLNGNTNIVATATTATTMAIITITITITTHTTTTITFTATTTTTITTTTTTMTQWMLRRWRNLSTTTITWRRCYVWFRPWLIPPRIQEQERWRTKHGNFYKLCPPTVPRTSCCCRWEGSERGSRWTNRWANRRTKNGGPSRWTVTPIDLYILLTDCKSSMPCCCHKQSCWHPPRTKRHKSFDECLSRREVSKQWWIFFCDEQETNKEHTSPCWGMGSHIFVLGLLWELLNFAFWEVWSVQGWGTCWRLLLRLRLPSWSLTVVAVKVARKPKKVKKVKKPKKPKKPKKQKKQKKQKKKRKIWCFLGCCVLFLKIPATPVSPASIYMYCWVVWLTLWP